MTGSKTSTNETSMVIMSLDSLSTSERSGAIVVGVFSLLSALAFAFMAFRIIRFATTLFLTCRDGGITSRPPEILFFRTQLGRYAGCLILSNVFISAAGLFNFGWATRSVINPGSTCSAQAVLMQIGIWGTCWFTAAHGLHTLSSLGFHRPPSRWRGWVGVALGWAVAFVSALAPLSERDVYGPIGSYCSVTRSYPTEILILEALPILLGALISIVVYFVIFVILHGKLGENLARKLGRCSPGDQRGERDEEYRRFICVIIRSMFWFPFAFVLLCLPFCITHILMSAKLAVPTAACVFADCCISMLGLVNVGLLCNTFRVVAPVYHGPRAAGAAAETLRTFGHDASYESPAIPRVNRQPMQYSSTQVPWGHPDPSWPSVDSNTELLSAEKVSYQTTQTRVVPLMSDIPDTGAIGREAGEPTFIIQAGLGVSPEVTNKSTVLAARLGISSADSGATSQTAAEEFDPSAVPAMPLCHVGEAAGGGPGEGYRPSSSFSTGSNTDTDSDYAGEIIHVHKVWPLSQISEASHEGSLGSHQRQSGSQTGRASMASVWSQETGYTLSLQPDAERTEAYRQLIACALGSGTKPGDRADIGGVISRPVPAVLSIPPARRTKSTCRPILRPIKVVSNVSTHLSNILSPRPSPPRPGDDLPFESPVIIIGPNGSIV